MRASRASNTSFACQGWCRCSEGTSSKQRRSFQTRFFVERIQYQQLRLAISIMAIAEISRINVASLRYIANTIIVRNLFEHLHFLFRELERGVVEDFIIAFEAAFFRISLRGPGQMGTVRLWIFSCQEIVDTSTNAAITNVNVVPTGGPVILRKAQHGIDALGGVVEVEVLFRTNILKRVANISRKLVNIEWAKALFPGVRPIDTLFANERRRAFIWWCELQSKPKDTFGRLIWIKCH
jgi:hypothetical protein